MTEPLQPYPDWLEEAVVYNLYPQSFKDSNADGIGDLPGITDRLDYIAALGCNVIWLNPIYVSPFRDAGYDVADYCKVAPRYGTNEDAATLFSEANKRGIRVLLDFVPGHTSDRHPWFRKSARHKPNKYSDRYIWTDATFTDAGPRFIGGAAEREGQYMANFFYFQPALNYGYAHPQEPWQLPTDHPRVQELRADMKRIMQFWLDMGASGFRVDMAGSLIKGENTREATIEYWMSVREWWDVDYPDCILLAEWSNPMEAITAGFHLDFMIHSGNSAYTSLLRAEEGRNVFPGNGHSFFDRAGRGNICEFLDVYMKQLQHTQGLGLISVPTGNHDLPRFSKGRDDEELKVILAFILTLPGVPTLYYGDEIGMRNVEDLPSKEGGYIRTQARTPMQWDEGENAGFSTADPSKLYLPVDPDPDRPTVADQLDDPQSLFALVRDLISLRRSSPSLCAEGSFIPLYAQPGKYPLVYLRSRAGESHLVALNPADRRVETTFAFADVKAELMAGHELELQWVSGLFTVGMPAVSYAVYRLSSADTAEYLADVD